MSNQLYWRTMLLSLVVFILSVSGLVAYWLTPAPPPPEFLEFPKLHSPQFTYGYWASTTRWEETELDEQTGRRILLLLRGSRTWGSVVDEYCRQNPEKAELVRQFLFANRHAGVETRAQLIVQEEGLGKPVVEIHFLASGRMHVEFNGEIVNLFVMRPSTRAEVNEMLARIESAQSGIDVIPSGEPAEPAASP
jgi:hypothetical protein